jgi:AraC-like DNA-binding protein
MDEPGIGLSTVVSLINTLQREGIAHSEILASAGLTPQILADQDARVPLRQYLRLWDFAIHRTGDAALGLKSGTRKDVSDMGIVGHVVYNSENLAQGLEQYIRLFDVVNDAVCLSLRSDDKNCALSFVHKYPEYYCIPDIERSLVLALYRTRKWVGQALPLESVHFSHKAPAYESVYRRTFGCPVFFNQDECKLVFASQYLQLQSPHTNPYIRRAALQYANGLLERIRNLSLAEQVKACLYRDNAIADVTVDRVASRLNMSKQTLYRKLKVEGLFFQRLVETVRFDKARQMLSQSGLSTSEIALLLGFSELSAFSRAFKRWSGMSPKRYREQLSA